MRLSKPRLEPLKKEAYDDDQKEYMKRFETHGEPKNIFKTLIRHPTLLKRWMVFGNHILAKSSLPPRERELIILRIGWLCRSGYEWSQHAEIGENSGLTPDEIEQIKKGPDAGNWSKVDKTLLKATDELFNDAFISDDTWKELEDHFNEQQLMDIIFTVGNYNLVSMALNTLGVQLESTTKDRYS